MAKEDFLHLQQKMLVEQTTIRRLLDKIQQNKQDDDEGFVPPATHGQDDEAERVADMEMDVMTKGNLKEALADIENALEKIDTGGYGLCETCGKNISLKRLEFLPAARYCIECQRKQEQP